MHLKRNNMLKQYDVIETKCLLTGHYVVLKGKVYRFIDILSRYYDIIEWENTMYVAATGTFTSLLILEFHTFTGTCSESDTNTFCQSQSF